MPTAAGAEAAAGPTEARARRVGAAIASPAVFGHLYVRPYDEIWREKGSLPHLTRELLAWMPVVRRGVVITPPEFLKTTALHTYCLWLTYRAAQLGKLPTFAGMLTAEEAKHAERNLSVITWHIEHNERLASDFVDVYGEPLVVPDLEEDKWTDSEIVVRRAGTMKDPTWQAKGISSKGVQGARLLHVVGDDVITPRSADSPAEQKKALRLWDKQVTTRLREGGQALLLGNFNHPRDLVSTLESRPSYAVFRRPALHVPGDKSKAPEQATDPDAIPNLPEVWSRERLEQERTDKPGTFRAVMLLDAEDEQGRRLPKVLTVIGEDETPLNQCRFVISTDGAPGGEQDDPDFFNITILAVSAKHADIVVCHDMRAEATEQVDTLAAYVSRYQRLGLGVAAIGIPKVALDHYFRGAVLIGHPHLRPLLQPISVPGSKEARLEALGPFASNGWLRCWDSAYSTLTSAASDRYQELTIEEQWSGFPSISHDDKLDGIDVGIRTVREHGIQPSNVRTVKLNAA